MRNEYLPCWRKENIEVSRIFINQLFDDPGDVEGDLKIENIRARVRTGQPLPAVAVIHQPGGEYSYDLIEGRHRYNGIPRRTAVDLCVGRPPLVLWGAGIRLDAWRGAKVLLGDPCPLLRAFDTRAWRQGLTAMRST